MDLEFYKSQALQKQKEHKKFLENLKKKPPKNLDYVVQEVHDEVFEEIDCLSCANCCKTMSPTFTNTDIRRIANHVNMTPKDFMETWLEYDKKDKEWMNSSQPCQFLNMTTHMCSIYEVRPIDCAGFPHLKKKKMVDYIHVHQQNVAYCPATFKMVEKMMMHLQPQK